MKSLNQVAQDKNFLLRFAELIVCVIGLVLHHEHGSLFLLWGCFGWFFIAMAFLVAYLFEHPNIWTEFILLLIWAILMIVAACDNLGIDSVIAFIAAAMMIMDLVFLFIFKRK